MENNVNCPVIEITFKGLHPATKSLTWSVKVFLRYLFKNIYTQPA